MHPDSAETCSLLDRLRQGDRHALDRLLERYRPRMRALVAARLDTRVRARIDPSDIVQEAQLDMARRIDDYLQREPMPFHLWARKTAYERLLNLQRRHRARRRAIGHDQGLPASSLLLLARPLLAVTSPSQQLQARELAELLADAIGGLSEADREILLMRHGEELPYEEIAILLDIEPATARKRYGRALIRLQKLLSDRGLVE